MSQDRRAADPQRQVSPPYQQSFPVLEVARNLEDEAVTRILAVLRDEYRRSGALWRFRIEVKLLGTSTASAVQRRQIIGAEADSIEEVETMGLILDAMASSVHSVRGDGNWYRMCVWPELVRKDAKAKDTEACIKPEPTTTPPSAPVTATPVLAPTPKVDAAPVATRAADPHTSLVTRALRAALAMVQTESVSIRVTAEACLPGDFYARHKVQYVRGHLSPLGRAITGAIEAATAGMSGHNLLVEILDKSKPVLMSEEWEVKIEAPGTLEKSDIERITEKVETALKAEKRAFRVEVKPAAPVPAVPVADAVTDPTAAQRTLLSKARLCRCTECFSQLNLEEAEEEWKEEVLDDESGSCGEGCECEWDDGEC